MDWNEGGKVDWNEGGQVDWNESELIGRRNGIRKRH